MRFVRTSGSCRRAPAQSCVIGLDPDAAAYGTCETIDGTVPTRLDSLYGVSKTFVENLGRYYLQALESVLERVSRR